MSTFANVNGEIKELYRIFFNDNGVIRELKTFHAQNDNNEIKSIFERNSNTPNELEWVVYGDGDDTTLNSVTNNGYTISGTFTNKKRSVATKDRKHLLAGTQIKVELSNVEYNTSEEVIDHVDIYLFDTQSKIEPYQSDELIASSNTMTVRTTGNYYIALSIYGHSTVSNNIFYCTADVNINIYPPKEDLEWVAYNGDSSTINSVTNKGYIINVQPTEKKRSIATKYKKYLLAGTQIGVKLSNTVYNTNVEVFDRVNIYLFDTESASADVQSDELIASSNTMTVQTTGNYYIAFNAFGRDANNNLYYCTTDVTITIIPPT